MAPGYYTSPQYGWFPHRNGDSAMTGSWASYIQQPITNNYHCIIGRDSRSSTYTNSLSNSESYDGDSWTYQDFGNKYYDECQLLASEAGASIITPQTIGQSGDGYWLFSVLQCNTYEYFTSSGTSFSYENLGGGSRSSARPCMVGYMGGGSDDGGSSSGSHGTEDYSGLGSTQAGGCSYDSANAYYWVNMGDMTWKQCAQTASDYAAMMAPGYYTSPQYGWFPHRNGDNAMTGSWASYVQQAITSNYHCIIGRDGRSDTYTNSLSSSVSYDGDTWTYEDFGNKYYD